MSIKSLGEFGLIGYIKDCFGNIGETEGITGIGDDCAIIPQSTGLETLVSTDMLVEGSHFLISDITPFQLGWKSAAVNLSDIAAMGGKPVGTFLSFALPKDLNTDWIKGFIDGYRSISEKYGCPLLGGDTTSSPDRICINVTVLGQCAQGQSKKRCDAQTGDLVCVTGPLGDSGAGLQIILDGQKKNCPVSQALIKKHYMPEPRVAEGLQLSMLEGVHAMMDISDGIGSDLRHILKASGKGARIDCTAIPLSEELKSYCAATGCDPLELAISAGEDYELLFTCNANAIIPIPYHVIGQITDGRDIEWTGADKDYNGYHHF